MDAQTVVALVGLALTGGTALVVVTVYAVNARKEADGASHKARNVESALTAHVEKSDRVYVRKETLGPQIEAIQQSLERIEDRQGRLIDRFMGPGA